MAERVFIMRNHFGKGICAGLSACWIKASFRLGGKVAQVGDIGTLQEAVGAQQYYETQNEKKPSTAMHAMLVQQGFAVKGEVAMPYRKPSDVFPAIAKMNGYMLLGIGDVKDGHAFGIRRETTKERARWEIFDPNYGYYRCSGEEDFVKELTEILGTYSWDGELELHKVKPASVAPEPT